MEVEALELIDRFGAQAIYGRVLGVSELRAMYHAERIVNAYRARARAESRVDWNEAHPASAKLLYAIELEMIDG